jgi:uncharacterized protein (DUF362 family)
VSSIYGEKRVKGQGEHGGLDRRDFLRRCAAGASLTLLPASATSSAAACPSPSAAAYPASPVVAARSDRLKIVGGTADAAELRRLLDAALIRLTGAAKAPEAWRSLFKPNDVVALKLNCLARGIATRPEVTAAIVEGLKSAGIPARNIIIWERTNRELEAAGYKLAANSLGGGLGGARCFGTDALNGGGYEPEPEIVGDVGGCFSQVLTRMATAVISVPVLKDHDLAGVSGSMKNNYGVIHNPNRYHDNNCDPYVAQINSIGYLTSKQRLVVCDAVTAQCNAGPAFKPDWAWGWGGLIVSRDPVAADSFGAGVIEDRRREQGLPTLTEAGRPPRWLETAISMGLGNGRTGTFEILEVG